jgi:hypothetical protein
MTSMNLTPRANEPVEYVAVAAFPVTPHSPTPGDSRNCSDVSATATSSIYDHASVRTSPL